MLLAGWRGLLLRHARLPLLLQERHHLAQLAAHDQILWKYCDAGGRPPETANPNGALQNIAGICNERRNVAGLMPHPERACEPLMGSSDGLVILRSMAMAAQPALQL